MSEKQYKPSPWENPESYQPPEVVSEPARDRTLREYIELKLSVAGFAVDVAPGGDILAWPRAVNSSEANYIIGQSGENFIVKKAEGRYARSKTKKAMGLYLKEWREQYKMGARD